MLTKNSAMRGLPVPTIWADDIVFEFHIFEPIELEYEPSKKELKRRAFYS